MSIFDFSDGQAESQTPADRSPRKRKAVKAAIGFGGLASLAGIGSTLAANITLNQGGAVEFGQGVAQTVACDSDGFNLTPVSYYDSTNSIFRLDYVQVSGIDLTPIGTGHNDAGLTLQQAIDQHPGQYFSSGNWTNTCDQVVLDFKAYTNDPQYSMNTVDGYGQYYASGNTDRSATTTASPLYWSVNGTGIFAGAGSSAPPFNSDVALVFDSTHDSSNYATSPRSPIGDPGSFWENSNYISYTTPSDVGGSGYNSNSSFKFMTWLGHYTHDHYVHNTTDSAVKTTDNTDFYDPAAGAIAKVTVESMKYFPAESYAGYGSYRNTLGKDPVATYHHE